MGVGAYLTRPGSTSSAAAGKVINDRGKYETVWKKGATGGWKAVVDTNNSDLPPASAAVKKAAPKKIAPKAKKTKR